jgi:TPR repeat protein
MSRIEFIDTAAATPVARDMSADALYGLGMMYATGGTVGVDLVAAHKWFNLAARRGRYDALAARREISELMSHDEIARAQREARDWLSLH